MDTTSLTTYSILGVGPPPRSVLDSELSRGLDDISGAAAGQRNSGTARNGREETALSHVGINRARAYSFPKPGREQPNRLPALRHATGQGIPLGHVTVTIP